MLLAGTCGVAQPVQASSHREAPLIAYDPQADNTDLYAFRSPDAPNTVSIIANFIPFEVPEGGPNYFTFGENVRYEIHIKNRAENPTVDDITYRFTFNTVDQDPTTFFNIRLGQQNQKTTYVAERSVDGGTTWTTVVTNGVVPPANIGPRSINSEAGLGASSYESLMTNAITTAATGSKVFCGPVDDPFFVDLGGAFDLGQFDSVGRDGLAGFNCHTIALQIPINLLQKDGKTVDQASNILDPDFVIGVWASTSRQRITTLSDTGGKPSYSGDWVQVSRLGMPLTNEVVIPIGQKDKWNSIRANDPAELQFASNFVNPELGLYIGNGPFSAVVPGLQKLRIDSASRRDITPTGFDFRNGKDGLYPLKGNAALDGTALADAAFGNILLQDNAPRSVDLLPAFYTGVPNLAPYQLATGKLNGNPLAIGKPFIHNFLPTLGDMLRLNMAVPPTPRNSPDFSSLGLLAAAVAGLTNPMYANTDIQAMPNMDGFPNGRRLEDDVTTIEMLAVGGIVLNAIGLWTDDFTGETPLTPQLLQKLSWNAGVTKNDVALRNTFPYMALPHEGYSDGVGNDETTRRAHTPVGQGTSDVDDNPVGITGGSVLGFFVGQNYPNPVASPTQIEYHVRASGNVAIAIYDVDGRVIDVLLTTPQTQGSYTTTWAPREDLSNGTYFARLYVDGSHADVLKLTVQR
ncbi:MAG TPA: DUF4331 family protein [Candidatus Kapabacteria bacterium]|nr:DUF4331 family protein [Candidatus Kapabacteria bacterium]